MSHRRHHRACRPAAAGAVLKPKAPRSLDGRGPRQRAARRWLATVVVGSILCWASSAPAQVEQAAAARVKLLNEQALEQYDSLEFEAAKKLLEQALTVASQASLTSGAALVQTYLNLGIVQGAGLNHRDAAVEAFVKALQLDPQAKLEPARATPALEQMFAAAKQKAAAAQQKPERPDEEAFVHQVIDEAPRGRTVEIRARAKPSLGARRVVLFYRVRGSTEFERVVLDAYRGGVYQGEIPAADVQGPSIYYYVEAQNAAGGRVAGSGTAASPNIIALTAGGPASGAGGGTGSKHQAAKKKEPGGRKLFSIGILAGFGVGVVAGGESEHPQPRVGARATPVEVATGAALAPFHLAATVAYHLTPKWHLGALVRVQVVSAVNRTTRPPLSVLGIAQAKRFFGDGMLRGYVSFGGGGGQVRHRIPLGDYDQNPRTPNDVVDSRVAGVAAFAVGGGMLVAFSEMVGLVVGINGLILVPDFAAHADINTGVLFSF